MYEIKCQIKGVAPLLHDNPWDIIEGISGKKPGESAYKKFDERMLYKENGMCCVPSKHIKGAMKNAARRVKLGRRSALQDIKASFYVKEKMISLAKKYDFIDVNVFQSSDGKTKVKERPAFKEGWTLDFTINIMDDGIPKEKIKECLTIAGMLFGMGSRRPDFGRFIISKFN